jgi:hypothetical protein
MFIGQLVCRLLVRYEHRITQTLDFTIPGKVSG